MSQSAYDFSVKDAKGGAVKLKDVAGGKVSLFVNVASQCGFTPQYKGLQSVHDKYSQQGFSVLAFPCNEFGGQEPGSASDVSEKMCERFKTTFPIYDKVRVKGFGDECEPVWKYLKENSPVLLSKEIWWNFEKVLVDRQGKVVRRYASTTSPESISGDIEKALGA